MTVVPDGRLRVDAYIDTYNRDLNNALFDEFAAKADSWQTQVGLDLTWERLDDKRASRIAAYRTVDLDDPADREATRHWAVDALVAMYNTLNTPLRAAAKVRRAARVADLITEPAGNFRLPDRPACTFSQRHGGWIELS